MGALEQYDCRDWANYLAAEYGPDVPIYLAGVSMGATTVMMASKLDLPQNVRGIMADCGFTSMDEIWGHIIKDSLHLPYEIRKKDASRLCEKKLQVSAEEFSTIEAMEHCQIPVFFAHGTEDQVVPVEMTYRNYEACAAPKKLLIVPGAIHGASYLKNPVDYEKMLKEFWEAYDNVK